MQAKYYTLILPGLILILVLIIILAWGFGLTNRVSGALLYPLVFFLLLEMVLLCQHQKELNYDAVKEICMGLLPVVLFVDLALLSPYTGKQHLFPAIVLLTVVLNFLLLLLTTIYFINRRPWLFTRPTNLRFTEPGNLLLPVVVIIYIGVKLFYLDATPRWDGAWYFSLLINAVQEFDFSPGGFLNHFNWLGHPSMGYALVMSLGQFIDPGNHYLLNGQNLILSVLAIVLFYKIVAFLFSNGSNQVEMVLLTTLFAFNPLFFGVSLSLGTDFPLLVFWTACIWALCHKRLLMLVFFGTLLVFSKETGALLYFMLLAALFFIHVAGRVKKGLYIIPLPGKGYNIRAGTIAGSLICLLTPAVLFIIYLVVNRDGLWVGGSSHWDSSGFNTFGFNAAVLGNRLFEIFGLNFSWLQTGLILLLFIKTCFCSARNKNTPRSETGKNYLVLLGLVFAGFVLFNLFYITFIHPRYILVSVFFLPVFCYFALVNLVRKKNVRIAVLAGIVVLSTMQVFITIDPLSKLVFPPFQFGRHQMLSIGDEFNSRADGLIYNSQYTNIEQLLNKMNREMNISAQSTLILSDDNWVSHINGARLPGFGQVSTIGIDRDSLKRTFKTANTMQPQILYLWHVNQNNKPAEAYYVHMWFGDEQTDLAHLQKYYQLSEARVIEHRGYYFKVYKLQSRE